MSTATLAHEYATGGMSVIPIRADGSKGPAVTTWKQHQKRRPSPREIDLMFRGPVGIGIIGGEVSGNLEIVDFDDPELFEPWAETVEREAPGLLVRLPIVRTPSGGRHVLLRCETIEGNQKLAQSEPRPQFNKDGSPQIDPRTGQQRLGPETLIETRGEGGYIVAPGSPIECHIDRLPYIQESGPAIGETPTITPAERETLLRLARMFNRFVKEPEQPKPASAAEKRDGLSPGDDFNRRADWGTDVLIPHGWTRLRQQGEQTHWQRPGKSGDGASATTGCKSQDGRELLCVFSSNAYPLDIPPGETCGTFDKFGAYARLNHGSDFTAAARDLAAKGYGEQQAAPSTTPKTDPISDTPLAPITAGQLIADNPKLNSPVVDGLLREGETGNIVSASKVGKSWLAHHLAFSVVLGGMFLGRFRCSKGRVLLIDNELHGPTLSHRLKTVAEAMLIDPSQYRDHLHVLPARGRSLDLLGIEKLLDRIEPGTYSMILLDAWYRATPADVVENDNVGVTGLYNIIDAVAGRLGCAWVNIHHSSKGGQGDKAVTDVGAGAGSQSRAADSHIILRAHEEPECAVLEAAVRSFAPVDPLALRWCFPLWLPDGTLDATKLKGKLNAQEQRQGERDTEGMDSLLAVLGGGPATERTLRTNTGISKERCERLLGRLEREGRVESSEVEVRGNVCLQYQITKSGGSNDDQAFT